MWEIFLEVFIIIIYFMCKKEVELVIMIKIYDGILFCIRELKIYVGWKKK